MTTDDTTHALHALTPNELQTLRNNWFFNAADNQLSPPPDHDWRIWLFMGGRGSGKTRAGAEWIAQGIRDGTMQRVALVGATHHDARSVMIEGQSGLLSVSEGAQYEPTNRRILWTSGAIAHVLSADEPDSIRGHQFDACWGDEFCKWPEPQQALDMILMALRLGENPKMAITTTPRNIKAMRELFESKDVWPVQSSTRENAPNLPGGYMKTLNRRYAGTRLGRQEIDGDLIDDVENAVWKRPWIEAGRIREKPPLQRVVIAVDPPVSPNGDECGIVVAGRTDDGKGIVLADRSRGNCTGAQWAQVVIDAYEEFEADQIIAEGNNGGDLVRLMITQQMADAPVKMVHATRDKRTRAQPVSSLYERGLIHHLGTMPELEDQMCSYDGTGKSPDRMDALVWALSDLFLKKNGEPKVRVIGE